MLESLDQCHQASLTLLIIADVLNHDFLEVFSILVLDDELLSEIIEDSAEQTILVSLNEHNLLLSADLVKLEGFALS